MNRLIKTALLAGAAWSACSTFAMAQDAQSESTVEEIIVTARRTEESLQRTPLAVTAFSGATLERIGAQQITDIQGAVPNLNIVQGRASSNATNIYIRGIGQPDALQTFDPAVGVYVDDVFYSRIRGSQFDLLDLERVEVLRGPQGTLYGKNTIAGALKLVSRRPDDEFRARGSVAVGDYDLLDVQASVTGPIAPNLAFSLSALHSEHGGYVTNPVTHDEYNDKNTDAVRGRLAWNPASNLRVDFIADYSKDDAAMTVGQATNTLTNILGVPVYVVPVPPPEFNFETVATPSTPNSTRLESAGFSANVAVDLSDSFSLKSITAYRRLNSDDYLDFDAIALELSSALVAVDQDQLSQEFQLNYESGPINAVAGLFYMKENIDSHQEAYADDLLGPVYLNSTFTRTVDDTLETTSKAAFANISFALSDDFRLSAGIRTTQEEKDYDRTTSTFYGSLPAFNGTFGFAPPVGKWDDTSIMLSADYQAGENTLLYARYAQGFKSGGFNGRANSAAEATEYEPETADTFEFGSKMTMFDNHFRLNTAVFWTKYQDFQARVSGIDNDPITGLPTPVLSVINAGELDIKGIELEAAYNSGHGLTLDAQIGWLDANYEEFGDARFTSFGGSRAFQRPAFAPEWTSRFGAQYVWDLSGDSDITFGGSAKYRGRMALAVDNTPTNSNVELPGMFQDEYWLFDARVVWNPSERYSVGIYGQNLSDEVYKTDAQEFSSVGAIRTAYYGAPQTWMVKVTARY